MRPQITTVTHPDDRVGKPVRLVVEAWPSKIEADVLDVSGWSDQGGHQTAQGETFTTFEITKVVSRG